MTHLTDDELFRLTERTEEDLPYQEQDLKGMEHLKWYQACYNKFCSALALVEVTSESGYLVLSEMYGTSRLEAARAPLREKVLAIIEVARTQLHGSVTAVLKRIEQVEDAFQFAPSLAFATRGGQDSDPKVLKVEDLEDGRTFLLFDSEKNELFLQINLKKLDFQNITIYLTSEGAGKRAVPLDKKGNLLQGIVKNIPKTDFRIEIEQHIESETPESST